MKKKVLILGVAPVQLDIVNKLKSMGLYTYTIAQAKDGPAADAADIFEPINFLEKDRVMNFIKENDIDVIYSVGSDLAMPVLNEISEELGLPHFVSSNSAYICNHKNLMRNKLGNDLLNVPYIVLDSKVEDLLEYPFIMKPSDSQGQRGVNLITNRGDFDKLFDETISYSRDKKVILEKFINGQEVSVNGYMVNGKMKFLLASDRITWPDYTGLIHKHVIPSKSIDCNDPETLKLFESVCLKMGINNGPVYFQIIVENKRPYIIEMTPRLDGCHMWKLIKESTGIDILEMTINHLLNDEPNISEKSFSIKPMELEFFCQAPNSVMNRNKFTVNNEADDVFFYYNDGEIIRPVNNHFEKVGYQISKIRG